MPFERIERMQEQLEEEQLAPTADQMREALEMLRSVLATKKVGITERNERFRDILRSTGTEGLFTDFVEIQPEEGGEKIC
jgi:[acyl-carrier-protein] S-malonyltransferase